MTPTTPTTPAYHFRGYPEYLAAAVRAIVPDFAASEAIRSEATRLAPLTRLAGLVGQASHPEGRPNAPAILGEALRSRHALAAAHAAADAILEEAHAALGLDVPGFARDRPPAREAMGYLDRAVAEARIDELDAAPSAAVAPLAEAEARVATLEAGLAAPLAPALTPAEGVPAAPPHSPVEESPAGTVTPAGEPPFEPTTPAGPDAGPPPEPATPGRRRKG